MTPQDDELLDSLHTLDSTLSRRVVLLRHVRSDVDVYAEGLRDLGNDLTDLGAACLQRVSDLDLQPSTAKPPQPERIAALSHSLTTLALDFRSTQ